MRGMVKIYQMSVPLSINRTVPFVCSYEITWEVLQFISNNMKQRVGECSTFNFDFVKTFLEAYYDSFDIVFEKLITGTYKPK